MHRLSNTAPQLLNQRKLSKRKNVYQTFGAITEEDFSSHVEFHGRELFDDQKMNCWLIGSVDAARVQANIGAVFEIFKRNLCLELDGNDIVEIFEKNSFLPTFLDAFKWVKKDAYRNMKHEEFLTFFAHELRSIYDWFLGFDGVLNLTGHGTATIVRRLMSNFSEPFSRALKSSFDAARTLGPSEAFGVGKEFADRCMSVFLFLLRSKSHPTQFYLVGTGLDNMRKVAMPPTPAFILDEHDFGFVYKTGRTGEVVPNSQCIFMPIHHVSNGDCYARRRFKSEVRRRKKAPHTNCVPFFKVDRVGRYSESDVMHALMHGTDDDDLISVFEEMLKENHMPSTQGNILFRGRNVRKIADAAEKIGNIFERPSFKKIIDGTADAGGLIAQQLGAILSNPMLLPKVLLQRITMLLSSPDLTCRLCSVALVYILVVKFGAHFFGGMLHGNLQTVSLLLGTFGFAKIASVVTSLRDCVEIDGDGSIRTQSNFAVDAYKLAGVFSDIAGNDKKGHFGRTVALSRKIVGALDNEFGKRYQPGSGIMPALDCYARVTEKVINTVASYFTTWRIDLSRTSSSALSTLRPQAKRLVNEFMTGTLSKDIEEARTNCEIASYLVELLTEQIDAAQDIDERSDLRYFYDLRNKMRDILAYYDRILASASHMRPHPVVCCLSGGAGIGKTILTGTLARAVLATAHQDDEAYLKQLEAKTDADLLFWKNLSKHWEGMSGQPVYVFDDFGRDKGKPGEEGYVTWLMQLVGSAPMPLEMATLDLKGRVFARPEMVFLSTNLTTLMPFQDSLNHIPALQRRLEHVYDIKLRRDLPPEFFEMKGSSKVLSATKLKSYLDKGGSIYDMYEVSKVVIDTCQKSVGSYITMREMVAELARNVRSNKAIADGGFFKQELDKLIVPIDLGAGAPANYNREAFYKKLDDEAAGSKVYFGSSDPVYSDEFSDVDLDDAPHTQSFARELYRNHLKYSSKAVADGGEGRKAFTIKGHGYRGYGKADNKKLAVTIDAGQYTIERVFEILETRNRNEVAYVDKYRQRIGPVVIASAKYSGVTSPEQLKSVSDATDVFDAEDKVLRGEKRHLSVFDLLRWFVIVKLLVMVVNRVVLPAARFVKNHWFIRAPISAYASYKISKSIMAKTQSAMCAMSKNTTSALETIHSSMVRLVPSGTKPYGDKGVHGIAVGGRNVLLPNHFVEALEHDTEIDFYKDGLKVVTLTGAMMHSYDRALHPKCCDVVMINFPFMQEHRQVLPFVSQVDGIETYNYTKNAVLTRDAKFSCLETFGSTRFSKKKMSVKDDVQGVIEYEQYYKCTGVDSYAGMCGLPYVSLEKPRCLFAMHLAGRGDTCIGVPLTVEDIDFMKAKLDDGCYGVQTQSWLPKTVGELHGFEALGHVPEGKTMTANPFSCLKKSLIHDEVWEQFGLEPGCYKPARLRAFDAGDERVNVYANAIRRYDTDVVAFNSHQLYRATQLAIRPFMNHDYKVINFETAVSGIDGVMRGIDRNKSNGFPPDMPKRREAFGTDKYVFDNESAAYIKGQVLDYISACNRGERTQMVYADFLKDELLDRKKVSAGKTRLISSSPVVYYIAFRMLFGELLIKAERDRISNGIAIGVNPYTEWGDLRNYLAEVGDNVFAGDFSGFDAHQQRQVLEQIWLRMCECYDDEYNVARRIMGLEVFDSVHLGRVEDGPSSLLYKWRHCLPSGHPGTALINSLYNITLFGLCYEPCTGRPLATFKEHVRIVVMGDDNIVSVSDEIRDKFNLCTISDEMSNYGQIYTDADKTGNLVPYGPIEQATFLKRSFTDVNGVTCAPVAYTSIVKSLAYVKPNIKAGVYPTVVLRDSYSVVQRELCLHGEDTYNRLYKNLVDLWNGNPRLRSYEKLVFEPHALIFSEMSKWSPLYMREWWVRDL